MHFLMLVAVPVEAMQLELVAAALNLARLQW